MNLRKRHCPRCANTWITFFWDSLRKRLRCTCACGYQWYERDETLDDNEAVLREPDQR